MRDFFMPGSQPGPHMVTFNTGQAA